MHSYSLKFDAIVQAVAARATQQKPCKIVWVGQIAMLDIVRTRTLAEALGVAGVMHLRRYCWLGLVLNEVPLLLLLLI